MRSAAIGWKHGLHAAGSDVMNEPMYRLARGLFRRTGSVATIQVLLLVSAGILASRFDMAASEQTDRSQSKAPDNALIDPADSHPGLNLIPWPQTVKLEKGRMRVTAESRIVAGQAELKPLAEVVSGEIAFLTGLKLTVTTEASRPGDIVLKINRSIRANEPILAVQNRQLVRTRDGAHGVTVGDQALVEGFDYRAVAEGSATLLQALSRSDGHVSLPRLTIHDWPHAD